MPIYKETRTRTVPYNVKRKDQIYPHRVARSSFPLCTDNRITDGGEVVRFTHRPHFTPLDDSRSSFLDDMEKWIVFTIAGLEPRPIGRPGRSQSLRRLRYRRSCGCAHSISKTAQRIPIKFGTAEGEVFTKCCGNQFHLMKSKAPHRDKVRQFLLISTTKSTLQGLSLGISSWRNRISSKN
jgi:hypothetical protein